MSAKEHPPAEREKWTTIGLRPSTKASVLDALKVHARESYDEELNRLLGPLVNRKPQEAAVAGGA